MKHLFICLLALILCAPVIDANESSAPREKITIREKRLSNAGNELSRSVLYVDAYFLQEQSLIELYHEGIGDAEVYVFDNMNHCISQDSISAEDYVEYISVPSIPGIYNLIIISDIYYGEATITVQ